MVAPGVIRQLDIRLHGYESSEHALDALGDAVSPGEAVAMLSSRGELYELNSVGLLLWDKLRVRVDEVTLVAYLADRYEIDETAAAEDVGVFLGSMAGLGLIEAVT